ncbi:hypothetical protein ACQ86N_37765 [Puia sp. P3]|uniref:hypothetical protein n=1 Tax=Puia sp. P3 TaxID=3423952 RepID=UPI003D664C26
MLRMISIEENYSHNIEVFRVWTRVFGGSARGMEVLAGRVGCHVGGWWSRQGDGLG